MASGTLQRVGKRRERRAVIIIGPRPTVVFDWECGSESTTDKVEEFKCEGETEGEEVEADDDMSLDGGKDDGGNAATRYASGN